MGSKEEKTPLGRRALPHGCELMKTTQVLGLCSGDHSLALAGASPRETYKFLTRKPHAATINPMQKDMKGPQVVYCAVRSGKLCFRALSRRLRATQEQPTSMGSLFAEQNLPPS